LTKIFSRRACLNLQRIGKSTVTAMLTDQSPEYNFLSNLDESQWDVVSFDPFKREVCIVLYNNSGNKLISVKLPYITPGL